MEEKLKLLQESINKNKPNGISTHYEAPLDLFDPRLYTGLFYNQPNLTLSKHELTGMLAEFLGLYRTDYKFRFIFDEVFTFEEVEGRKIYSNNYHEIVSRISLLIDGHDPVDPTIEVLLRNVKSSDSKFISFGTRPQYQKTSVESVEFNADSALVIVNLSNSQNNFKEKRIPIPVTQITLNSGKTFKLSPVIKGRLELHEFLSLRLKQCVKNVLVGIELGVTDFNFVYEYFQEIQS